MRQLMCQLLAWCLSPTNRVALPLKLVRSWMHVSYNPHLRCQLGSGWLVQVIGAAAMLGGVTRMTISITVLAMEGSGALQLTAPLMVAVFVAKMVGDALTPSVYDVHIKIRGAPVLVKPSPVYPV